MLELKGRKIVRKMVKQRQFSHFVKGNPILKHNQIRM